MPSRAGRSSSRTDPRSTHVSLLRCLRRGLGAPLVGLLIGLATAPAVAQELDCLIQPQRDITLSAAIEGVVAEVLVERGVIASQDSIRVWCQGFGTQIAAKIRRDRPAPADTWHLDEVVISIRGQKHWPWRAIDANGDARESGDGRREVFHASASVDLKAICFAIYEATSVADLSNDQAGAEHLAWSYELYWISHAHDLRRFLARRILKQRPS